LPPALARSRRRTQTRSRRVDSNCCLQRDSCPWAPGANRRPRPIYDQLGAPGIEHPTRGCEDRSIARALAATYVATDDSPVTSTPGRR
jgi:hypothetical protein